MAFRCHDILPVTSKFITWDLLSCTRFLNFHGARLSTRVSYPTTETHLSSYRLSGFFAVGPEINGRCDYFRLSTPCLIFSEILHISRMYYSIPLPSLRFNEGIIYDRNHYIVVVDNIM